MITVKYTSLIIVSLASMLLSLSTIANVRETKEGWQLIKEAEGVMSYKRQTANNSLMAFKATAIIDAPVHKVLDVLIDSEQSKLWIPKLKFSEIIERHSWPNQYLQFTRFNAPWPVKDRIFLSQVNVTINPLNFQTDIHYSNSTQKRFIKNTIRGNAEGSHFTLEPRNNGKATYLVATSMADPNGFIPKWLINWVSTNVAHDTIILLRAYIKENPTPTPPEILHLYPTYPTAKTTHVADSDSNNFPIIKLE